MNIAVCDDMEITRSTLSKMIKSYFLNHNLIVDISTFSDASSLLNSIQTEKFFDIIFLDIEMPGMSGMECATHIKVYHPDTIIIFVTSHQQYAIEAFSVEAFDYIEKEKLCQKINPVLERCLKKHQSLHQEILFSNKKQHISLALKDILYVESYRKEIIFHLVSGEEIFFTYKLGDCAKQLQNFNFSRCRLTLLVNLLYVKEIKNKEVTLTPTQKSFISLPIGNRFLDSFMDDFIFYKTRKRGFDIP